MNKETEIWITKPVCTEFKPIKLSWSVEKLVNFSFLKNLK